MDSEARGKAWLSPLSQHALGQASRLRASSALTQCSDPQGSCSTHCGPASQGLPFLNCSSEVTVPFLVSPCPGLSVLCRADVSLCNQGRDSTPTLPGAPLSVPRT